MRKTKLKFDLEGTGRPGIYEFYVYTGSEYAEAHEYLSSAQKESYRKDAYIVVSKDYVSITSQTFWFKTGEEYAQFIEIHKI